MPFARHSRLKFSRQTTPQAIFTGWGIALSEYCRAVPADRIGYGACSETRLQKRLKSVFFLSSSALSLTKSGHGRTSSELS
jgi:uncharacterized protein (DUF486 family)